MNDNEPLIGIEKSTRHHQIVGRFGEHCVCNWLSRSGFEVCIVDHTGMDVIAYHPVSKERLGITVKSRQLGFSEDDLPLIGRENALALLPTLKRN